MRRKRFFLWTGLAVAGVASLGTALVILLYHEPSFYVRAHIPPSDERKTDCVMFLADVLALADHFADDGKIFGPSKEWTHKFSAKLINSFLEEEEGFQRASLVSDLARHGISE